ncbi:MAG: hypothetical protein ACYTG3_08450 [Planctomycetota bacterium]
MIRVFGKHPTVVNMSFRRAPALPRAPGLALDVFLFLFSHVCYVRAIVRPFLSN